MSQTIASQVALLQQMTVAELRVEWEKVFGEPTKQRHRVYLWKRLARKLQEDQLPKLTAEEEAQVAEYQAMIRQMPPEKWFPGKQRGKAKGTKVAKGQRVPPPGSVITRDYKGHQIAVTVLDDGFEYDGQVYRSLSAIARQATGTSWNGYTFFHLDKGARQ